MPIMTPNAIKRIFCISKDKDIANWLPSKGIVEQDGIRPAANRITAIMRSFVIIFFEKGFPVLRISSSISARSPSSTNITREHRLLVRYSFVFVLPAKHINCHTAAPRATKQRIQLSTVSAKVRFFSFSDIILFMTTSPFLKCCFKFLKFLSADDCIITLKLKYVNNILCKNYLLM